MNHDCYIMHRSHLESVYDMRENDMLYERVY